MKDFVHTGYYAPTMTTTDDPLLNVIETDNGINWILKFYVGDRLIDAINLEHGIRGSKLNDLVLELPVKDDEDNYIGTVEEVLLNAYNVVNN